MKKVTVNQLRKYREILLIKIHFTNIIYYIDSINIIYHFTNIIHLSFSFVDKSYLHQNK